MQVIIIGAGLSGLSAAIELAKNNISSRLVSLLPSERAQSVLAEGGINGALNTMGEDDCPENHFADTMKAGVYIADPEAVRGLSCEAPEILMELKRLGVPFNLRDEQIQQRNFGGQKKKRTAYARSSTGKVLMSALIDEARKYEAQGLILRYPHHELIRLLIKTDEYHKDTDDYTGQESRKSRENKTGTNRCYGVVIQDKYTDEVFSLYGPVLLAYGGMNGIFPGHTTGTVTNSGDAAALVFSQGVRFSNLEMIQYHPTTISIAGKRCLVSEAARGEGGRLYIECGGKAWYFMEEKYPELGNLMPRDVVAREMFFVSHHMDPDHETSGQVYLDMRHLPKETWQKKLPDLRHEIMHYLGVDPVKEAIPVEPGIHYFMGGIDVDVDHQSNIDALYASGECCSQYHGANRLGGNSTMGAIYGGKKAARAMIKRIREGSLRSDERNVDMQEHSDLSECYDLTESASADTIQQVCDILLGAMGIVRSETELKAALDRILAMKEDPEQKTRQNSRDRNRICLAEAMLRSAICRKESRGAHYRSDYPETREEFKGRTVSILKKEPEKGGYSCFSSIQI